MSTQSNQTAGADAKSCPWCRLWNAAFAASQLPVFGDQTPYRGTLYLSAGHLRSAGVTMLDSLLRRTTDCTGCRRSAEIYRGNVLGERQAAWRAAMWLENPVMRQFMRAGPGDTFGEPTGD